MTTPRDNYADIPHCSLALVRAPIRTSTQQLNQEPVLFDRAHFNTNGPDLYDPTNVNSQEPVLFDRANVNTRSFNEPQRRPRGDDYHYTSSSPFDKHKQYYRSFSQPPRHRETVDDREFLSLDRNSVYRTVSQPKPPKPPRSNVFDMNQAIHDELISSPWGTWRRQPRKRDRYAIYIPSADKTNTHPEHSDVRSPTIDTSRTDGLTTSNETSVLYGTYRRAPRSYPRIDAESGPQFDPEPRQRIRTEYEEPWESWGIPQDNGQPPNYLSNGIQTVSQRVNDNTKYNDMSTDSRTSVKHLFSVPLKDVRQLNSCETLSRNSYTDIKRNIKKIENNLYESDTNTKDLKKEKQHRKRKMSGDKTDGSGHGKPFFYCRWITSYPKTFFLLTLSGHILIALITIITLLVGYDLFPTEFEFLPMYDLKVPWMKRDFAWRFRDDYKERYVRKWYIQGLNKWYRSTGYDRANIVLYYDTGGGNIFTKDNLQQIERIENRILNSHNYTDYCVQTALLKCQRLNSIISFFDGTYAHIDPVFNDTNYDNIPKVLHAAKTNNATKADFAYFLAKNHLVSKRKVEASVTRTLIPMGYPIKLEQKPEDMEKEMEHYLAHKFKPLIDDIRREDGGFHVIYWSFLLFKHEIVIQIFYDLILAIGSIMFIFGFIVYHTKSLWISSLAVSSILTCFLCTNIVYRVVLDFRYFGFFHVITLFIILGIGADDLFVFLDVWKDTEFRSFPSLAHRLSSAYKKSMKSMFFTSLTTTVAFFVSGFSPLLATKSFGIFAGVLVIVNYISVVVYFPTVVILHHIYFKDWNWPCFSYMMQKINHIKLSKSEKVKNPKVKKNEVIKQNGHINHAALYDDNSAIDSAGNLYNVVGKVNPSFKVSEDDEYGFVKFVRNGHANGVRNDVQTRVPDSPTSVCSTDTTKDKEKKFLVRFFKNQYFKFVTHWLIKWIIVFTLVIMVMFFGYSISTMETENEPAQFYRNSHNYGRALQLDFKGFVANKNDRNVVVYIVWGLKERDMDTCHFSDARCIGEERLDMKFDPNSEEAQLALKKFCDKLLNFDNEQINHFRIRRDFTSLKPEIKCFATDMDKALKAESELQDFDLSMPWNYRKTMSFMQSRSHIYNTLKFNTSFPHVFEIPMSYWLNDGYRFRNKTYFNMYQDMIGEGISEYSSPLKTDYSVFYGNRIVYLGVQVNLTLGRFSSGYPEGKPVLDRWENFVQNEVRQMPHGLQNGFQLTKDYWHNLSVQKTIEDGAIQGIVIGILLAFPILTIATRNVLIGLFATLSMCCSTICVVGIIPLFGWKLGLLEALNMCMVVGLTVDYVVHLAEGYHMSKHSDRKSRTQDMLEVMGISVFSGACTTLGASIFMFFAQIQFIIKFGMFMFCTIGFSLIYSLGLFTTVMGIIGPEGDRGSIDDCVSTMKMLWMRLCSRHKL